VKRIALIALGLVSAITPAAAQYYPYPPQRPHYYEPAPRPYYRPDPYGWGAPPRYRPVVVGNICYTSRGSCRTRPAPEQSPCGCNIPGFGFKRGGVIAQPQW
jgi:hypothetical protein